MKTERDLAKDQLWNDLIKMLKLLCEDDMDELRNSLKDAAFLAKHISNLPNNS